MKLSIIIPAYNEEASISETIEAIEIAFNHIKIDYEILVINDNSKDNTSIVLDELCKAIFIQNSLISTWTIAYSIRLFLPYSSKYNFVLLIFRCTVTILNGSAMLMMLFYEGFILI